MAKTMFVLFQILIPILLLNMLIAMMGNTYAIVNEKSEKEFLKQVHSKMFIVWQLLTYVNIALNSSYFTFHISQYF